MIKNHHQWFSLLLYEVSDEIIAMIRHWQMWWMLATQDIKIRYQRSAIGPMWVTVRIAVTIYTMGYLYGHLFQTDIKEYLPFIASGLIGWGFISSLMSESSYVFSESALYIKNQETFLSIFIVRMVCRNIIVFFHNLLAFIPMFFFFHAEVGCYTWLLIPNILLIALLGIVWGGVFAFLGARYRDFPPLIHSVLQILFFLTPVMWMSRLLPQNYQSLLIYNVLSHILVLIRNPLLNQPIEPVHYEIVITLFLFGFMVYIFSLKKYKHSIVFWL